MASMPGGLRSASQLGKARSANASAAAIPGLGTLPVPLEEPPAPAPTDPGAWPAPSKEALAMPDRTRPTPTDAGPPAPEEIPLSRDLTTCVVDFVRDRATPIAEWVTWTGGDPELVILVVAETLRSIADGLEADAPDD